MRKKLSKKDQYLNKLFYYKNKYLELIKEKLIENDKWGINVGYHELSILDYIIKSENITSILEIGTLYGFSTYGMSQSMSDKGEIISIEKNKDNFTHASHLLSQSDQVDKIKVINTDAIEYLKTCEKKFDLIFIDANKAAYLDYLKLGSEKLNKGGLIIGDNTFLFGHTFDEGVMKSNDKTISVMKEFNSQLIHNDDYQVTILPTTEGMTLIKKLK